MKLLLDTHILLWAAGHPDRLPAKAHALLADQENDLVFSAASLWEISIKSGLGRADFSVDGSALRRGLLEHGYTELAVNGVHALTVQRLPPIHKDPFDRILVAQATTEALTLVTADPSVAQYPGPVLHV